jgi:hypothetical protein
MVVMVTMNNTRRGMWGSGNKVVMVEIQGVAMLLQVMVRECALEGLWICKWQNPHKLSGCFVQLQIFQHLY